MAAAHLSHHFPGHELYHIYDSSIPSIGVGEGTLPGFRRWLHQITGLGLQDLQHRCNATPKLGVRFEGWGSNPAQFDHRFAGGNYAYHLSAAGLCSLLGDYVIATRLDRRVATMNSNGHAVDIEFHDGSILTVDLAFDARGFPQLNFGDYHSLEEIPTNRALLRREPGMPGSTFPGGMSIQQPRFQAMTRAIARPHGWIFAIPLVDDTSYGYVYHAETSQSEEVSADFDRFMRNEGIVHRGQERILSFPSFSRRTFFDGALFRIGNAASFLEPLEATALGVVLLQLQGATFWLRDELVGYKGEDRWLPEALQLFNAEIYRAVRSVALFVSWHYARGSAYDTRFWRHARDRFEQAQTNLQPTSIDREFERFLQAGERFPASSMDLIGSRDGYERFIKPHLRIRGDFGGFDELSFAQIGRGIGYYRDTVVAA